MRGEHLIDVLSGNDEAGSSPHARGAQILHHQDDAQGGDHPRMRGEHYGKGWDMVRTEGSSPHARGALAAGNEGLWRAGIIPACAGSTKWAHQNRRLSRDHPRMRGEHRL